MAEEEKEPKEEKEDKEPAAEGEPDASLEELEQAATGEGGGKSKKKIIILAAVIFVVIAAAGALLLTKMLKKHPDEAASTTEDGAAPSGEEASPALDEHGQPIATGPVYYEMDEFLVNLNTGGKQVKFLKMKIILELPNPKAVPVVEDNINRIRDSFQVYLRELRSEDLQGSGGIYRLREELLLRINKMIYPTQINNILFKDILVQ